MVPYIIFLIIRNLNVRGHSRLRNAVRGERVSDLWGGCFEDVCPTIQCLLALLGGGWVSNFQNKSVM